MAVRIATCCQVNELSTLARPARPMRVRRAGSRSISSRRAQSASGSRGGTRNPVSPSTTVKAIPPTCEPITGVPHAMASSGVSPNGSYQGVVTATSAAAYQRCSSSGCRQPANRTRSSTPSSAARARSTPISGVATWSGRSVSPPTTNSVGIVVMPEASRRALRRASACTTLRTSLRGTIRPT